MVLEVNFYFLLKKIQARQGKITFNVQVVASETGNQLALWVTWAMFTVKATKAHKVTQRVKGREGFESPSPQVGAPPLHQDKGSTSF